MKNNYSDCKKKYSQCINNDGGYVLIISLLIMVVLTVIGVAATRNTSIELQIAGNDKLYMTDFYTSEANAFLVAQILEDRLATDLEKWDLVTDAGNPDGLIEKKEIGDYKLTGNPDEVTIKLKSYINTYGHEVTTGDAKEKYLAVDKGIAGGSSLALGSTTVHSYDVYGYSSVKNGKKIIRIGYKKRF